jgi:hypothetical protein
MESYGLQKMILQQADLLQVRITRGDGARERNYIHDGGGEGLLIHLHHTLLLDARILSC